MALVAGLQRGNEREDEERLVELQVEFIASDESNELIVSYEIDTVPVGRDRLYGSQLYTKSLALTPGTLVKLIASQKSVNVIECYILQDSKTVKSDSKAKPGSCAISHVVT